MQQHHHLDLGSEAGIQLVPANGGESLGAFAAALRAVIQGKGNVNVEHIRDGNVIAEYAFPNGIVDVGMNALLGIMFNAVAQITAWYIGLIDNSGFTALANADTMASHAGWNEFTTYSEVTRVEWVEGAAAARAISNPSPSVFNITGSGTIKGIFVTSSNTKSGTTGTLWATAAFASNVAVVNGDQLKVTYTVSG